VGFKAPTSIGNDVTWTLPSSDGSSGEVLTTDGTGNLSWGVASSSTNITLKARKNVNQNIPNNATTALTFEVEDYDTGNMFTPGDSFWTIQTTGVYLVTANAVFNTNNTGYRRIYLFNNTTPITESCNDYLPLTGTHTRMSISSVEKFSAGDSISIWVYQNSGGGISLSILKSASGDNIPTHVTCTMIASG
jgi:trimeric autotransporter adhesin